MGKIKIIKKARKDYTCSRCSSQISKGDTYYRGEINFGPTIIRCNNCKLEYWEATTSEYSLSVGEIKYRWKSNYELDTAPEEIVSDLQEVLDECQEKLDSMPESLQYGNSGELLQERISQLECAIEELEVIDTDSIKSDAVDLYIPDDYVNIDINSEYDSILEDDECSNLWKGEMISYYKDTLESEIESALDQIDV